MSPETIEIANWLNDRLIEAGLSEDARRPIVDALRKKLDRFEGVINDRWSSSEPG